MNDTERVADLEAQITRLQKGIRDMNFDLWDMIGEPQAADTDEQITARYLHPGDLDPIGGSMSMSDPDHFYLATFEDVDISQTTDSEPVMMRRYTIHAGPWDNPIDTWDGGWLSDEQWDSAVVLGFKGTRALYAYHELMSDVPTEDALDATSAEDALFSRGETHP